MGTFRVPSESPDPPSSTDTHHRSQRAPRKRPKLSSTNASSSTTTTDPMSTLAATTNQLSRLTHLTLSPSTRPKISIPDPAAPGYYHFASPPPVQSPPCKYGWFDLPESARMEIYNYLLAPEAKEKVVRRDEGGLGQAERFIETNIYCGVPIEAALDTSRADRYLRLRSDTDPGVSVGILRTGRKVHDEAAAVLYANRHFRFAGRWVRDGRVVGRVEGRTVGCEMPLLMARQWLVLLEWLGGLSAGTRALVRSLAVWLQPAWRGRLDVAGGFKSAVVDGMQGCLDLEYLVKSGLMPTGLVHLGVEVWTGPWWFGLADRDGFYFDGQDMRDEEFAMGSREQDLYRLDKVMRALRNMDVELHVDAIRQGGLDPLSTRWTDLMRPEGRQVYFDTTFVAQGVGRMLFPYRLQSQMREEKRLLLSDNPNPPTGTTPVPDWAARLDNQTTMQRDADISGIQELGFTNHFNAKFSAQGPLDEDVLASEEEARLQAHFKKRGRRGVPVQCSLDAWRPRGSGPDAGSQAVVPTTKSPERLFEREIKGKVVKVAVPGSASAAETERFEAWMVERTR